MITIEVNDQEIYIEKGTSFVLEMNNNIFDFDKIEGDVIYTFDVPADKNGIVFEHADYIYIKKEKIYRASVKIGGIPFASGNLIVQSARKDYISIAMSVNYFPIGYSDKKLKNNNYKDSQLGIEPTTWETHWDKIDAVIAASMLEGSVVKFPAFYCKYMYGTKLDWDAPQWGWGYEGDPDGNTEYFRQYIANRFIFGSDGQAYNPITLKHYPEAEPGAVEYLYRNNLFNTNNLVPVIQLSFLLKKSLEAAGYHLIGDFVDDEKILRIFYHSMKNLDATPRSLYNSDATNDYQQENYNIFTPSIKLEDHCPDLTNKEFLNIIFRLFGTTFYVDSINKTVEISLAQNILKSKTIDLTDYILRDEMEIQGIEKKCFRYHLPSMNQKDFDQNHFGGEVAQFSSLPTASGTYLGKIYLCKLENELYECKHLYDSTNKTYSWGWVVYSGNDIKIDLGSSSDEAEPEEIEPNCLIPSNIALDTEESLYSRDILPNITHMGLSDIYPTSATSFKMILTYYYDEIVDHSAFGKTFSITRCYPTNEYRFPSLSNGKIDLKTTGSDSLGQNYMKKYVENFQQYEEIEMKFLFPLDKALEVMNLLKPQSLNSEMQTRYVMVDNVKLLPKQMNFQFTKGHDMVLSEIKFAKHLIDL